MAKQPLDNVQVGRYGFPEDNIPVKEKEEAPFHLQIALSIYGNDRAYGNGMFYNDREKINDIIRFLLGLNPESDFMPFLGVNPNANDKTWTKAIDFAIKNYATKRVNIIIKKMMSREYDVSVNSINPLAIDSREDMKARLQLYMDFKAFFENVQKSVGISTSPDGVEQTNIPLNRADLDLFMDIDYKTAEEIGMELGIQHHMARNKYKSVRHQMAFQSIAAGVSACYTGLDENVLPEIQFVDVKDLIVPSFKKLSSDNLPYVGEIIWMTAQEFRKKAEGYLIEEEINYAIKNYSRKPDFDIDYTNDMLTYDNVSKIAVMRYNYRSTDTIVRVSQEDDFGNKKVYEKPFDYYASPKEAKKFRDKYGNKRKLYRETYNAVYEGYWVVNSKLVFRYGRRAYSLKKRGNFSEDLMGYKIFAPTSWNGHVVSLGAQMIPMLKDLQRYHLKIQQLVARAIPKGVGVDLYALRKANLKWDNKDLSDQQKIEMFIRSGIFVFDSKDRYAPGSNYKPFYEVENGISKDIPFYIQLMQQSLADLDEVIGLNRPSAASALPSGEGKGTTELQLASSDVALGFLFDNDQEIYQEVVESVGALHVQSVRYGPRPYYDRIFGKLTSGVAYSEVRFDKCDYGFSIDLAPKQEEWNELYAQAEKAYDKGVIRFSDVTYLRSFKSIKQARRYLSSMENKYSRERQQESLQLQQANGNEQIKSVQAKAASDAQLLDKEHQYELEMEAARRETLELQADLDMDRDMRNNRSIALSDKETEKEIGYQARLTEAVKGTIAREIARIGATQKAKKAKQKS